MDGVSSMVAVVSLAIQLVDSVHKARAFVKDIQNASNDLVRLGETLDQLYSVLTYVRNLLEQQFLTSRLPGTPALILDALQDCERKMEPLKRFIDQSKESTNQRHRVHRALASSKLASKKEDLQQLERQLRDAKSDLQFAITGNIWQLQMHQLELTKVLVVETTEHHTSSDSQPGMIISQDDRDANLLAGGQKSLVRTQRQESNKEWYRGIFGTITIQKKAKFSNQLPSLTAFENRPLAEETAIKITPSFIGRLLELRLASSLGKVSRNLSVYPIVPGGSPVFEMCRNGDIHGLQVGFSSGTMSPFVLDENGGSLLHCAASDSNVELCSWLIELNVDPDRMDCGNRKAMHWSGLSLWPGEKSTPVLDTMRLLAQAQEEFSITDLIQYAKFLHRRIECAEFMLSQYFELEDTLAQDFPSESTSVLLAAALRTYGWGHREWESVIRKLIRKGVDVHGRVNQYWITAQGHEEELVYSTPLDELFQFCAKPYNSKELADGWLQILSSEGFDVRAYLGEEIVMHDHHNQLTWQSRDGINRQLQFELGETPSVWWEWYAHPASPIFLAQAEYRHISLDFDKWDLGIRYPIPWQDRWPFDHPEWSEDCQLWEYDEYGIEEHNSEWRRRISLAQERANRRYAKRIRKLTRGQEKLAQSQMPGSWIE